MKISQNLAIRLRNPYYYVFGSILVIILLAALLLTFFFAQKQHSSAQQQQNNAKAGPNYIQKENQQPGDTRWQMENPSQNGEIQAYAGKDSINIGESVNLYVSTKVANTYQIDIYRLGYYGGKGGRLMQSIANNKSIAQGYYPVQTPRAASPINCPTCILSLKDQKGQETYISDANWKVSTTLHFSPQWISGIYEIKLTNGQGYEWMVPLVVRDDSRKADLIFQDPLNTDQCYNEWGGTSCYRNYRVYGPNGTPSNLTPPYWAFYITYDRPYLQESGGGNLFAWTYPMLRFLEQQGYDVTYSTNVAIAEGKTNLSNYKGFLSTGHDEYVSFAERSKIEQAVNNGVSIAYFGGNDMYWQTRSIPDQQGNPDRVIVEYKDYYGDFDPYDTPTSPNRSLTTTLWRASPVNNPEDRLLKEMYPLNPYAGSCNSCSFDFVVTNSTSWVYAGTGLHNGDKIKGIVGYEIESFFPNDGSITPNDHITIIGQSPFSNSAQKMLTAYAIVDQRDTQDISFDAGTIYWSNALSDYRANSTIPESSALEKMTNNILQRMIH